MIARTDLAATWLQAGQLDAAVSIASPALALPISHRVSQLQTRFSRVRTALAAPRYRGCSEAGEFDQQIEQFCRDTAVAQLHDLPASPSENAEPSAAAQECPVLARTSECSSSITMLEAVSQRRLIGHWCEGRRKGRILACMTTPAGLTGHVFISYVRDDAARADRLQQMLEAAGIAVWRDTSALRPGQDWRAEIRKAISTGAAFIACFSEYTEQRERSVLFDELAVAVDQMRLRPPGKVWLIPVRFTDCRLPDVELGFGRTLATLQWVDLFGSERDLAVARLIASVRDIWADRAGATSNSAEHAGTQGDEPSRSQGPSLGPVLDAMFTRADSETDEVSSGSIDDYTTPEIIDKEPSGIVQRPAHRQPPATQPASAADSGAASLRDGADALDFSRLRSVYRDLSDQSWRVFDASGGESLPVARRIAVLGAPASGKTTFLAALSTAVTRSDQEISWNLFGADARSRQALVDLDSTLHNRMFPVATHHGIEYFLWRLTGQASRTVRRRWGGAKQVQANADVVLEIVDASGVLSGAEGSDHAARADLISVIAASSGLVYVFDPLASSGTSNFTFLMNVLAEAAEKVGVDRYAGGGTLPHNVAVCISKFDEVAVVKSALDSGMLVIDSSNKYRFPRVRDSVAREFLLRLNGIPGLEDTELIVRTLERFFNKNNVKYFATSAVGFYVDPLKGSFDSADFQNVLRDESGHMAKIRGGIHPINVLEPVLWLCTQTSGTR